MIAFRHWRGPQRQLLLAAGLFLLSLRLLAPAGFMPQWRADGFALQFCDGVAAAPSQHHGHHGDKQQEENAPASCPYAVAAGHSFGAPDAAIEVASVAIDGVVVAPAALPTALLRRRIERPRSRGPPLSA